jgi:O-antigen ligase
MSTIENHQADESASTRLAVWQWTWEYAQNNPMGGGFDSYLGNKIRYKTKLVEASGNTTEIESTYVEDESRAFHSSYFELLGEQGWPGLFLWLWLQALGVWQMERIRRRWKGRTGEGEQWQAPLANALQLAQVIYLVGSLFVGIAYQPFIYMLIGLQCAFWSYIKRIDAPQPRKLGASRALKPIGAAPTA